MCGTGERYVDATERFGALAVLGFVPDPQPNPRDPKCSTRQPWTLLFYNNRDHSSPVATHIGFHSNDSSREFQTCQQLAVIISPTGDLTGPPRESSLLCKFRLSSNQWCIGSDGQYMELELPDPLLLQVGASGIIGRRISLFGDSAKPMGPPLLLAEGIVGFNHL
ncbi:hypothetical protein NKR23_g10058 [Pleurostoma richardsiae]|uniref:Uncharacterized protein n=1 Tax=Pleurostoma richardsiae TaxID=41990 RepID=A0AA38R523_9PEZI|nr:hypothetical protein NKR23_g10058 [Pleurostoma richardsiae]